MTTQTSIDPVRIAHQRLCQALGMTLSTGAPIVVGGPKCPPKERIAERMIALGVRVKRLTASQYEDSRDDGHDRRYRVLGVDRLPEAARCILAEDVAANTSEGDDVLASLIIGWPSNLLAR